MQRPDPNAAPAAGSPSTFDAAFAQAYPNIWSYLTDASWDDGKPRECSALSWTCKDAMWQLALNDKALKQSLYTSADSQKGALKLMEAALASGAGVWRPWKRGK